MHREPRPGPGAPRAKTTGDIAAGLRVVARDRWLRALTLFGAASDLALMAYQSIQVPLLVRHVGTGTARATLLFEVGPALPALLIPLTTRAAGVLRYAAGGFCVSAGVVAGNVLKAGFQQRRPELRHAARRHARLRARAAGSGQRCGSPACRSPGWCCRCPRSAPPGTCRRTRSPPATPSPPEPARPDEPARVERWDTGVPAVRGRGVAYG